MTDAPETRGQVMEVEIDAPPDDVWWAIGTPEGIRSWFVDTVEVQPGEGGTIRYVWEEMDGMAGTAAIEAWEPGTRLLLRHMGDGPDIREEWTIRPLAGGRSALRLVQSGIPTDAAWDAYVRDTSRGWRIYLDLMGHALSRHDRPARETVTVFRQGAIAADEAWRRILGRPGLQLEGDLRPGAPARIVTPEAEERAEIVDVREGEILVLRLPERGDRAIAFLIHEGDDGAMYWAQVSGYAGDAPDPGAFEPWLRAIAPEVA